MKSFWTAVAVAVATFIVVPDSSQAVVSLIWDHEKGAAEPDPLFIVMGSATVTGEAIDLGTTTAKSFPLVTEDLKSLGFAGTMYLTVVASININGTILKSDPANPRLPFALGEATPTPIGSTTPTPEVTGTPSSGSTPLPGITPITTPKPTGTPEATPSPGSEDLEKRSLTFNMQTGTNVTQLSFQGGNFTTQELKTVKGTALLAVSKTGEETVLSLTKTGDGKLSVDGVTLGLSQLDKTAVIMSVGRSLLVLNKGTLTSTSLNGGKAPRRLDGEGILAIGLFNNNAKERPVAVVPNELATLRLRTAARKVRMSVAKETGAAEEMISSLRASSRNVQACEVVAVNLSKRALASRPLATFSGKCKAVKFVHLVKDAGSLSAVVLNGKGAMYSVTGGQQLDTQLSLAPRARIAQAAFVGTTTVAQMTSEGLPVMLIDILSGKNLTLGSTLGGSEQAAKLVSRYVRMSQVVKGK